MANGDDDTWPPQSGRPRVYIYGRSPPPLDPDQAMGAADLPSRPRVPPAAPQGSADNPWEPGSFNYAFHERGGPEGRAALGRDIMEKRARGEELESLGGPGRYFDERPDVLARTTDERGQSLPELELKAQFLKSRSLWDPVGPEAPLSPMTGAAMAEAIKNYPAGHSPHLYEFKPEGYSPETKLAPDEQRDYEKWARGIGKNPKDEEQDYDLKGYWKDVIRGNPDLPEHMKDRTMYERDLARTMGPGRHFPDTYKKPTHPTFSDESIYNRSMMAGGVSGHGGHWDRDGKTFTPGITNSLHWSRKQLQDYFDKYEPENKLNFPDWYK